MGQIRAKGSREAYWRKAIARWEKSGKTQVAFCRKNSMSIAAFHWWKHQVKVKDEKEKQQQSRNGKNQRNKPTFVPLKVVTTSGNRPAYEVVLRGGEIIRLEAGFDKEEVSQLISVLEVCR